jgi:hypothetical protein
LGYQLLAPEPSGTMTTIVKKKWWRVQWFSDDEAPEEHKFLLKLDVILVSYLLLSHWVKNLDQSNISK